MIESFSENSIYWMFGVAMIVLLLTLTGFFTSLRLPTKERKIRVRKFALIGVALFCFCLPIFKPFISSYSGVKGLDEIKAENLNTIEDVAKLDKQQTRTIERLKEDVIELKRDTYRMHIYYSTIIQLLSMIIAMSALNYVFRKNEESGD